MPKKQPKNAFFFFMLEFKRIQEQTGRRFKGGMKEVATAASEHWKNVSPSDKKRFEEIAKKQKSLDKAVAERYTSQGKTFSQVKREEMEQAKKKEKEQQEIIKIIDKAVDNDCLETTPFYILSLNFFIEEPVSNLYYPAELGIVRFSVKDGIMKKFHAFINPGRVPLGYAFTVKQHSDTTHKLPVPPDAMGENDYRAILNQVFDFFIEAQTVSDFFPVFVYDSEMERSEVILRKFCDESGIDYGSIRLLPLSFFFYQLRVIVQKVFAETESQFTVGIAQTHLERDIYQYFLGNGCEFHESDDVNIHCALSRPTRWAYYIIDQTVGIMGGKKKPGFHFPKGRVSDDLSDDETEVESVNHEIKQSVRNLEISTEYDGQYTETSEQKTDKNELTDVETTTNASYTRSQEYANARREFLRYAKLEYQPPIRETSSEIAESESTVSNYRYEPREVNRQESGHVVDTNPFKVPNYYQRFDCSSDSEDSVIMRPINKEKLFAFN